MVKYMQNFNGLLQIMTIFISFKVTFVAMQLFKHVTVLTKRGTKTKY